MPSKIWAAVKVAALVLTSLIVATGCSRSESKQDKRENLGSLSLAVTQPPGTPGAACDRFVAQLSDGRVRYAVTFAQPQAYVEVFVQQNGTQNIATNIVSNGVNNGNGTYTYSYVAPATGYHSGDHLRARFYSYGTGQSGVFTPGPSDTVWAPDFIYGQTTCSSPAALGMPPLHHDAGERRPALRSHVARSSAVRSGLRPTKWGPERRSEHRWQPRSELPTGLRRTRW